MTRQGDFDVLPYALSYETLLPLKLAKSTFTTKFDPWVELPYGVMLTWYR